MEVGSRFEAHVAVFSFPFASHPSVIFNLVRKAAEKPPAVLFSFFGTEKSNKSLLPAPQNANPPSNIKAYSVDNGVPEGFDLAKNPFKEEAFFISSVPENFKQEMEVAVAETGRRITCLVTDAFFSFAVGTLAESLNLPWLSFWVPGSYSLSAHLHTQIIQKETASSVSNGDQTLDFLPGMASMRISDLPPGVIPVRNHIPGGLDMSVFSSMMEKLGLTLHQAAGVLVASYEELTPPPLTQDLKSKFKNLLYVGFVALPSVPLPPQPISSSDTTGCLPWLDTQETNSVAYISFGTTFMALPQQELVALAESLESSGVPFLWSLKDHIKNCLPDGFLERTKERGKILPWVPQTHVLGHSSVGVHVSHGGYNSVSESILCGVPLICRPLGADHPMNARMVEDVWGIGVGVEGGMISKNGMMEKLKAVLDGEEGKKMREAAGVLKETVLKAAGAEGNAAKDFSTFVETISRPSLDRGCFKLLIIMLLNI